MNRGPFTKSRTHIGLLTVVVLSALLSGSLAWGKGGVAVPILTPPLSQIPVPEPPNLSQFVKDKAAAIKLGKALFWDMQAGSDGIQACASCHYRAGADPINVRSRNQLHHGPDGAFQVGTFQVNQDLLAIFPSTFPLFQESPVTGRRGIDPLTLLPLDPNLVVVRNLNDIVGSQGIRKTQFNAIVPGSAVDNGNTVADPVFNVAGTNIRQVTGRNTPSAVNAVFNYANFWDGRANFIFNGVNPFGPLDQSARIWVNTGAPGAAPVQQQIAIPNASLASQATGPPLSDVEMSYNGRTFPQLGRKLLDPGIIPLGQQVVHPNDSVFSVPVQLSNAAAVPGAKGLNTTYDQMIQAAFQDNLWNGASPPGGFTQMQANFSLFWGLAVQLYEATLVSDRTPFDLFQSGNENALTPAAQIGLNTFNSKCSVCHSGSEFSSAVIGSNNATCGPPDCNPVAFTNNTSHSLIRQGLTNVVGGLSDMGFFNIGVRPTGDDPGRGGTAPSGLPLSFVRLAEQGGLPFTTPQLPIGVPATTPEAVQGSFKTPGLRNVELTPPYFHNGSALTLDEVVEFYTRGGNFPNNLLALNDNPNVALAVQPLGKLIGDAVARAEVVAFMKALTDERVRNETAPFDHPELRIPNGVDAGGSDITVTLPATGGAAPVVNPALTMTAVTSPTILSTQALSGTVDSNAMITVTVNGLPPAFAAIPCTTDPITLACTANPPPTASWNFTTTALPVGPNNITVTASNFTGGSTTLPPVSITVLPSATITGAPQVVTKLTSASLTVGGAGVDLFQYSLDGGPFVTDVPVSTGILLNGLADGTHTIAVLGKNTALNLQQPAASPTTATWTVKANPPVLTIDPVTATARRSSLTLGGTVELGIVPVVRADTAVTVGPVTVIGGTGTGTWSCQISGLKSGVTNFTVSATDVALNVANQTAAVKAVLPDGNIKGTGNTDISDALKALRIAIGLAAPSQDEMLRGDVAPLGADGAPAPDSRIDVADALVILRKVVGLVNF